MKISPGCPISLTTATPGCTVRISDIPGQSFPVVAWAVVCCSHDEDGDMDTTVQPVFLVDGETYTTDDWYRTEGPERGVKVVTE